MILEYHCPETLSEALELLNRQTPLTLPMGGGNELTVPTDLEFAVVDLKRLGLNKIDMRGNSIEIGATLSLENLSKLEDLPGGLVKAVLHEKSYNLRHTSTIAGTVVASDGRSSLAVALMALDAKVQLVPGDELIDLGQLLNARDTILPGRIITGLILQKNMEFCFDYVARTPADRPLVAVGITRWPSRRLRIVAGGFGLIPRLILDAPEPSGINDAIKSALINATDEWASAQYRISAAQALVSRCLTSKND